MALLTPMSVARCMHCYGHGLYSLALLNLCTVLCKKCVYLLELAFGILGSGTVHFHAKNYEISADLIERSMLYVSRDEESRSRRANCFRVLCLCHMALRHLDRAQEFIIEAEKVLIFLPVALLDDIV